MRALGLSVLGALLLASTAAAQQNVLDLRLVEVSSAGDLTYQNFIYNRLFADGRFLLEVLYLRVPIDDYKEVAVGAGYRIAVRGDVQVYGLLHLAKATDASYLEPAVLVQDTTGRFTASLFLQHYLPINNQGIHQWLVDPVDAQYIVRGPLALGASAYLYRPEGGEWLTKVGPKVGIVDKFGATELRIGRVNSGGYEFQLRRVFVF